MNDTQVTGLTGFNVPMAPAGKSVIDQLISNYAHLTLSNRPRDGVKLLQNLVRQTPRFWASNPLSRTTFLGAKLGSFQPRSCSSSFFSRISHKTFWPVALKSAISGHSSPPNAQIGASNPLFPDQDQAKNYLSNQLLPKQGSAGASQGLFEHSSKMFDVSHLSPKSEHY